MRAFTQVEASRTVNLQVSDDNNGALLGLNAVSSGNIVDNSDTGTNSAAMLQIAETNLNDDATTKVEPALEVTNNGGQDVNFYVDGTTTGVGTALTFEVAASPGDAGTAGDSVVGSGSAVTLTPGDTMAVDVIIDSSSPEFSDLTNADVTFVAETP